jgi:RNA polymerase sigma-70 factor, ECF subfamily
VNQDGLQRLFEELHSRHQREVWAVAYSRTHDTHLALDVAQEAFLRLWRELAAGTAVGNPRGWLLTVARHLAEDDAKSSFRRNGTAPPDALSGLLPADRPTPDAVAERAEEAAAVRAVIAELAPADREVLTLRYALGYDPPAIAEALGVAVSAVHMRLTRARQRLAVKLTERGVGGSP